MASTKHGRERVKERVGLSKKDADGLAERALLYGVERHSITGSLRRFIDAQFHRYGEDSILRVYMQKVFVFSRHPNHPLITVYDLKGKFRNIAAQLERERKAKIQSEMEKSI